MGKEEPEVESGKESLTSLVEEWENTAWGTTTPGQPPGSVRGRTAMTAEQALSAAWGTLLQPHSAARAGAWPTQTDGWNRGGGFPGE